MKSKQEFVRTKILSYLENVRKVNPRFSLRAFSNKVKINSGILSAFLKGDRNLSYENMERIVCVVVQDPNERMELLKDHNRRILEELKEKQLFSMSNSRELSIEEFASIMDWYHFAFLALIHTKEFQADINWIASRLGISPDQAIETVTRCQELGLIKIDENNIFTRTSQKVHTKDNDPKHKEILITHHLQFLQQSIEALKLPQAVRDITAITLPTNSSKIDKAREIIRKFQYDIEALIEDGEKDEVYRLCVQLYPVTKMN